MLQLAKLSDYRDPIVKRDFFAAYVRPAPASPPRRDRTVDPADFAFVTGFTEVDGTAQVWIQDRMRRTNRGNWGPGKALPSET